MDLGVLSSLLSRHRRLVILGTVASLVLAALSFVRISPAGVGYRTNEIWTNQSTLLLTQAGFREGRSAGDATGDVGLQRLSTLADLYAALVESDEVVNLLVQRGLIERKDVAKGEIPVTATPVISAAGAPTPLMTISGSSISPRKATALTVGATKAFIDALERRQNQAGIPASQRTLVQVVRRSSEPQLTRPRSKALPIIIFLAGISATVAAAFVRDNSGHRRGLEDVARAGSHPIHAADRETSTPARRHKPPPSTKPLGPAPVAEDATPHLATLDSEAGSAASSTARGRQGPPGSTPLGAPLTAQGQRHARQS